MRASTLKVVVGDATYYVDDPKLSDGLKASVSVVNEGAVLSRILHRDRLNLDSAKAREKFAAAAGTPADDLLEVRDRVLDFLSPSPPSNDATEPVIDPAVREAALALLSAPDVLDRLRVTIQALSYAGDLTQPVLIFLVLVSRLLSRPINVVIGGPSAVGKSFVVSLVARLFPAGATYALNGMSERVLVYTDADLRHRTLIIGEASALHRDGIGASLLRSIAWEGNVVYETVMKIDGELKPYRMEKPGPTGFITTTTKTVESELETRVLTLHVPDSKEATRDILLATAARANGRRPDDPDLRPWQEAQRWLAEEGDHEVTIPFAEVLGAVYPAERVRSRRDFVQLVTLIQASAILHQRQRERDADGRIIASEGDYHIVYGLAAPVFGAIAAEGVTPAVRETVAMVAELTRDPARPREDDASARTVNSGPRTVTVNRLASALGRDKSAVSRRVAIALRGGFLVNDETGKGKPYRLRLGDPLPEERPALPTPEEVFGASSGMQHCNTSPSMGENPHHDAKTTVAQADATVGQQRNGCEPGVAGVAGVAEVLLGPIQHSFSHGDAENDSVTDDCCSVAQEEMDTDFVGNGVSQDALFDLPDSDDPDRWLYR